MNAFKTILITVATVIAVLILLVIVLPDENDTNASDDEIEMDDSLLDPAETPAEDFYATNDDDETSTDAISQANVVDEPAAGVRHLSAAQFRRLVADYTNNKARYIGSGPCVVDFFAEWCGPCKQLTPMIERLAKKYAGRITFYKVDIDQVPDVATAYGIESIPTLMFCTDLGMSTAVGLPDEAELEQRVKAML